MTALSLHFEPAATNERTSLPVDRTKGLENTSQALIRKIGNKVGGTMNYFLNVIGFIQMHRGNQSRRFDLRSMTVIAIAAAKNRSRRS